MLVIGRGVEHLEDDARAPWVSGRVAVDDDDVTRLHLNLSRRLHVFLPDLVGLCPTIAREARVRIGN
jgi:hypothetical protein